MTRRERLEHKIEKREEWAAGRTINAPDPAYVARLALEWWRASGPRTLARLNALGSDCAGKSGVPAAEVIAAAQAGVRAWELEC